MIKIFTIYLIFIFAAWNLSARNIGETEITTDEGIEVFQNEKFYLLKKMFKLFLMRLVCQVMKLKFILIKIFMISLLFMLKVKLF